MKFRIHDSATGAFLPRRRFASRDKADKATDKLNRRGTKRYGYRYSVLLEPDKPPVIQFATKVKVVARAKSQKKAA